MLLYNDILKRANINDDNVINAYAYGSRVYGCATDKSDYDYIFILKKVENDQFSDNLININYYNKETHQKRLLDHEISALECHFIDKKFILKETHKFNFNLDLETLRSSLSAKSSNSWVKSKKKLTVKESYDWNIGTKSMFHSFRIIDFGCQIAKYGKIIDYSSCNNLLLEITSYDTWSELFDAFKLKYNQLKSEFRILVPKIK